MLSKFVGQNLRGWDDHLPLVLLAYWPSVHDSTSLSPAMMTYSRELDLPVDLIYGSPQSVSGQDVEVPAYVANLSDGMKNVHQLVRNKLAHAAE